MGVTRMKRNKGGEQVNPRSLCSKEEAPHSQEGDQSEKMMVKRMVDRQSSPRSLSSREELLIEGGDEGPRPREGDWWAGYTTILQ